MKVQVAALGNRPSARPPAGNCDASLGRLQSTGHSELVSRTTRRCLFASPLGRNAIALVTLQSLELPSSG